MELYAKDKILIPDASNYFARRNSNHLQAIAGLRDAVSVCEQYILDLIQFSEKPQSKNS